MGKQLDHYWFAYGFISKPAAEEALEKAFAAAEVSEGEKPRIEPYIAQDSGGTVRIRYGIQCELSF